MTDLSQRLPRPFPSLYARARENTVPAARPQLHPDVRRTLDVLLAARQERRAAEADDRVSAAALAEPAPGEPSLPANEFTHRDVA